VRKEEAGLVGAPARAPPPPPAAAARAAAAMGSLPSLRHGAPRSGGHLPGVGLTASLAAAPGRGVLAERRVWTPRPVFTHAFGGMLCLRVAAGGWHSAAVSVEGHLWTWGANEEGQCGVGDEVTAPEPARVARLEGVNVCAEALGARHTAVLVARGVPSAKISLALIDDADDWGEREVAEEQAAAAAAGGGGGGGTQAPPAPAGDGAAPRRGDAPAYLGARLPPQLRRARWKFLTVRRNAAAYGVTLRRRAKGAGGGAGKWWMQDADDAELGKHAAAWALQRMYRLWKEKREEGRA
jgi:hypothetical protein